MTTVNVFCLHVLSFLVLDRSCKGAPLQINKFEVMPQVNQVVDTEETQFSKIQDGFFPFAENFSNKIIEEESVVIGQREVDIKTREEYMGRSLQPLEPSYESNAGRNAALIKSAARNSENHDENGSERDRGKRVWKIRKLRSDFTEEKPGQENAGNGAEDYEHRQSVSAIFVGSVCAGVVVFPCLITILVCLWKRLKERCRSLCKNGEIKKEKQKEEIKKTTQDFCISSPLVTRVLQDSTTYTTAKTLPSSILTLSASEKLRSDVSMETVSGSSSAESCKIPVAPWEDVAVQIKDGDEQEVICKRENPWEETCTTESVSSIPENHNCSTKSLDVYNVVEVAPSPPGSAPLPTGSTELKRGKSHIGGTKALENRHFIKHLISTRCSNSLENDLKIAVSRILGEMKPRADIYRSRTKRLVIKRQTEETKYSLKESILRSKSVIMEENVDKSRDRRAARRRQAIQKTRRNQYKQYGVQRMLRLGDEIAFAKTIILPFPRRRRPKACSNNWTKPRSQLSIGSRRLVRKFANFSNNHRLGEMFRGSVKEPVVDLNNFPQRGTPWCKGTREREKTSTRFCPPPRKCRSMVLESEAILIARELGVCSSPTTAAPADKTQSFDTTFTVSFRGTKIPLSTDLSSEENVKTRR